MPERASWTPRRKTTHTRTERVVALTLTLVCVAVSYFFLHALVDLSGHSVRALTASWAGRGDGAGTVTVTERKRATRRTSGGICRGEFTPENGGPVRKDIYVHVHSCTPGSRVAAELVVGNPDSWNSPSREDQAYERGAAWGGNLFTAVFMGGFCLILGLLFGIGGIAVLIGLLRKPFRRPDKPGPSIRARLGRG
ncbi:hypothetical protein HLB23_11465 [Nocardia uniformis]|uniref:Uncharacterized protein n=1 Tax=Nocardia uniformis TaxID=53432 RepID=A0A849BV50_9NOCA|nr:hypothetical protein [Nocardia uniformis]NNH70473.1 hypothetical protein [Nocardia uniformis]